MARKQKLQPNDRNPNDTSVKGTETEIQVPVFILCVLIAAFIWLYVVGISNIPKEGEETAGCTGTVETTDPVEPATEDITVEPIEDANASRTERG